MAPQITLGQLIGRFEVILLDSHGVLIPWPGRQIRPSRSYRATPIRWQNLFGPDQRRVSASGDPSNSVSRAGVGYRSQPDHRRRIPADTLLSDLVGSARGAWCWDRRTAPGTCRRPVGKWCRLATNFDALGIGDRLGCPFLEATSVVLSNLLRKIDKGDTPHSYSRTQARYSGRRG